MYKIKNTYFYDIEFLKKHKKIVILGNAGSGKSWLSKHLARLTGYRLVHLDKEFWQPGWVVTPRFEWILKQQELMKGENWIIDGDYFTTIQYRFVEADLVIFLDINRFVCLWSVLKRRRTKHDDLPDYLDEPSIFSKSFWWFLWWIWIYPKNRRHISLDLHKMYPEKTFIQIKSRKEMNELVNSWERV